MSNSDLLNGWYVDSSPGGGGQLAAKCGALRASQGITGSSTVTGTYSADIGGRSTLAPGSHPSVNTASNTSATQSRQQVVQGIGFKTLGTVLFDGFAMMYGLPRPADQSQTKMSISFWISPDAGNQGVILSSPFSTDTSYLNDYHASPPGSSPGPRWDYAYFYQWAPMVGGSDTPTLSHHKNPIPLAFSANLNPHGAAYVGTPPGGVGNYSPFCIAGASGDWDYGDGFTLSGAPHATTGGSYTSGSDGLFYHVMISIESNGQDMYYTLAVNDTVIANHISVNHHNPSFETAAWPVDFSKLPDGGINNTDINGSGSHNVDSQVPPNVWNIGGRFVDFASGFTAGLAQDFPCAPEGDGMMGAVTEVWIDLTRYMDWTNSAVRNLFHTTDILGSVYLPTDIGAHGQTPTGSRPTMYFTGLPDDFVINRVNGNKMSVYKGTRNSLTMDGRYPGAL